MLRCFAWSSTKHTLQTIAAVSILQAQEAWWASVNTWPATNYLLVRENMKCVILLTHTDTALGEMPSCLVTEFLNMARELHYSPSSEKLIPNPVYALLSEPRNNKLLRLLMTSSSLHFCPSCLSISVPLKSWNPSQYLISIRNSLRNFSP